MRLSDEFHPTIFSLLGNLRLKIHFKSRFAKDSRYWHPLKSSWHPLLVCTLILVISACTVSTVVLSQVRREPPGGQQYGTYEKTRHNTRTCQAGIEINVSIEKWVGLINITSFHYSNGFYSVDVGVKP